MSMDIPRGLITDIVARALAEDLGGRGDITSRYTIPAEASGRFVIAARSGGVLSGVAAAVEAFSQVDPRVFVSFKQTEGDELHAGANAAEIEGPARSILTAERVALNFLGRMSGIATLTRAYAAAIAGTGAHIAHTRKTTPGLRALELLAVRSGGGCPHRYALDDAVLIKDNHVAVCGGVEAAVRAAKRHAGHMAVIAVEIDRLSQLDEALDAGAQSILLDNFSLEDLASAVKKAKGRGVTLEASGGVDLSTVRAIAETGVDVISVGAITHSAPNFDLGLDAV
ncbi:carboxylating nicotinate-nucleotide diphosphorylase [Glycocaulis profundi]|nr:carboxylating nicotinate-nucleotide diphosphorylase [Glycocaulis profundi]